MTMKGFSRKHIIILMNNDNIIKFMRNSLTHVANINRALRNPKSWLTSFAQILQVLQWLLIKFSFNQISKSLNTISRIPTISMPFKWKSLVSHNQNYTLKSQASHSFHMAILKTNLPLTMLKQSLNKIKFSTTSLQPPSYK